jgi:DNA-binding MarR family transcriptional regulator
MSGPTKARTAGKTTRTKRVDPADDEAASRLRIAALRLARRLRRESPPGITPGQYSALTIVAHAGPLTITELAAHENVQAPTISRIVDALARDGWVERVADPTDRRVSLVRSTARAHHELARIRAEGDTYVADRLAALDPADQAAILAALPALERLLDGDR